MHTIRFVGGGNFAQPNMRTLRDGDKEHGYRERTLALHNGDKFEVTDQELWYIRDLLGHGYDLFDGDQRIDGRHARLQIAAAGKPPRHNGDIPESQFEVVQPGTFVPSEDADVPEEFDWSPSWGQGKKRVAGAGQSARPAKRKPSTPTGPGGHPDRGAGTAKSAAHKAD